MPAKIPSPCLEVAPHLKRTFKARCKTHGHSMAEVLVGLIDGWMIGRYQVPLPDATARPRTIYIPARAYALLRARCKAAAHRVPMRAALERLITGWLEGRYPWPPKDRR
jgi:hypothetical protein